MLRVSWRTFTRIQHDVSCFFTWITLCTTASATFLWWNLLLFNYSSVPPVWRRSLGCGLTNRSCWRLLFFIRFYHIVTVSLICSCRQFLIRRLVTVVVLILCTRQRVHLCLTTTIISLIEMVLLELVVSSYFVRSIHIGCLMFLYYMIKRRRNLILIYFRMTFTTLIILNLCVGMLLRPLG
jgi:hypothetical protein